VLHTALHCKGTPADCRPVTLLCCRYVAAYGNIVPLHLLARCRQQLPYVLPSRQQVPLQPSAVLQQQALPALPDAVTRHRALALQQRHMQVDPDNWQELLVTEHQQQEQQEQQQGCRSSAEAASSSSGREGSSSSSSSSSNERRPSLSESMPQAKSARLSGLLGYISNGCSSLLGARRPGSGAAEGEAAGRKSSSRAQAKPYRPRLRDDVELDPWDDTAADVRSSSSLWGDESADMELEQQLQAQQARGGMPGTSSSGDAAAGIQAAMQLDDSAASQLGGLPFALLLESLQLQQRLNNVDNYSVQERELFMQVGGAGMCWRRSVCCCLSGCSPGQHASHDLVQSFLRHLGYLDVHAPFCSSPGAARTNHGRCHLCPAGVQGASVGTLMAGWLPQLAISARTLASRSTCISAAACIHYHAALPLSMTRPRCPAAPRARC
jgi:hypothetical protein